MCPKPNTLFPKCFLVAKKPVFGLHIHRWPN
jgi:hypothetical protein